MSLIGGATQVGNSMANYAMNPSLSGGLLSGNKLFGVGGTDFLGAGLQLLGGWMNQRNQRKEDRMTRQLQREQMMAQRAAQREQLRSGFQASQDDYSRTIMRNRAAIAPWGEMYRGPQFTTANPNAPIYNPLSDPNHMYNQLAAPLSGPSTMQNQWNGG